MLPVGLYVVGGAPSAIISAVGGDYAQWFEALAARNDAKLVIADGRVGEVLDPGSVAGIVITGSPASLTAPEPWMQGGLELIATAATAGTPVLGVCFGHQLIGLHAGGRVIRNPLGWEFATSPLEVTAAGLRDPLFEGCSGAFDCNQAHQDVIDASSLPSSVAVLAANSTTDVQALAVGDLVRGVQFHPEFTRPITECYLEYRWDVLAAAAEDRGLPAAHPERLAIRDCPTAERVFGNFIEHFARRA